MNQFGRKRGEKKKNVKMVETIDDISKVEMKEKTSEKLTVPVIFVEDRNDEVNGQIMNGLENDHYSPSVRNVYVSKPVETTSGFGFHLSRSKWDPYPYISRVDKDSYAAHAGLREGDCVLEASKIQFRRSLRCVLLKTYKKNKD